MNNPLIIHGHFYQPPREDPWTGEIPHQDSAFPFHDWNKRITQECYAANSSSRFLDAYGRILDIINNYEYLSFNFGPTLFWWLKDKAPRVYKRIIEADRISQNRNNNHGNALAQCYNHTILPLDTEENAGTQIIWGMEDFSYHFGRKPEGMWLAETAVNMRIIDILIEVGIQFIVLSPWQAEAVSANGSKTWQSLKGEPISGNRAYKIERPNGEISVFFYNHELASGISFGHYLRDADNLFGKLSEYINPKNTGNLINIATDGEIYGHHEPYGDMCLAALIKRIEQEKTFHITNYGYYLELNPPKDLVKLKEGEESKGTSWSCAHGVSRWYKDCGCSTGGGENWNQSWRTPLREAVSGLNQEMKKIFLSSMQKYSESNPADIKNDYISVLTGKVSTGDFIKKYVDKKNPQDQEVSSYFFRLLEGQKYAMYMFTSCGWFFSEISGLEGTQNLKYALKAVELYSFFTNTQKLLSPFLEKLKKAYSNIKGFKNGKWVMEHMVMPCSKSTAYPAAVFVVMDIFGGDFTSSCNKFGIFENLGIEYSKETNGSGKIVYSGTVGIRNIYTTEKEMFSFRLAEEPDHEIYLFFRKENDKNEEEVVLSELPIEVRKRIRDIISSGVENKSICDKDSLFPEIRRTFLYANRLGVEPSVNLVRITEAIVNSRVFEILIHLESNLENTEIEELKELLVFSNQHGLNLQTEELKKSITKLISKQTDLITQEMNTPYIEYITTLLFTVRKGGIEPDIAHIQNKIFMLYEKYSESFIEELKQNKISGLRKIKALLKLGKATSINMEALKERVFQD